MVEIDYAPFLRRAIFFTGVRGRQSVLPRSKISWHATKTLWTLPCTALSPEPARLTAVGAFEEQYRLAAAPALRSQKPNELAPIFFCPRPY